MFTRCMKQVLNKLNIQIHRDKELQVQVFVLSWNSFFSGQNKGIDNNKDEA